MFFNAVYKLFSNATYNTPLLKLTQVPTFCFSLIVKNKQILNCKQQAQLKKKKKRKWYCRAGAALVRTITSFIITTFRSVKPIIINKNIKNWNLKLFAKTFTSFSLINSSSFVKPAWRSFPRGHRNKRKQKY